MSSNKRRRQLVDEGRVDFSIPAVPLSKADSALFGEIAAVDNQLATISVDGSLQVGGIRITATGLDIQASATFADWEQIGSILSKFTGALQWLIGDWIVHGDEARFAVEREAVAAYFNLDTHTLDNYASVARQFPISRRRESLSFSHHETVAALPEDKQREYLDSAERAGWSVARLRQSIRRQDPTPLSKGVMSRAAEFFGQKWQKYQYYERRLDKIGQGDLSQMEQLLEKDLEQGRKLLVEIRKRKKG